MIIVTAANSNYPQDASGKEEKRFSFRSIIKHNICQCEKFGYTPAVFDLGDLRMGEKYQVADERFNKEGHYKEIKEGYKSKSLFKPDIIKRCLEKYKDLIVYLDGDALLYKPIDNIIGEDYDIGVTLRHPIEINGDWNKKYFDIVRYVNAGVIFFNPTEAAHKFVNIWQERTMLVENDQKALNDLVCEKEYPRPFSTVNIRGLRVKYFPCEEYNYYYFTEGLRSRPKILHFKGSVREFYPYDWKKKIYCRYIARLKTALCNTMQYNYRRRN